GRLRPAARHPARDRQQAGGRRGHAATGRRRGGLHRVGVALARRLRQRRGALPAAPRPPILPAMQPSPLAYPIAIAASLAAAALAWPLRGWLDPANLVMLFLLAV